MPGIARQFEPQITRSGGAPSKFRFTIRCSECARTDSYEASKPTSNDAVKRYFSDRGWLLGRTSSFDVCPACLASPRHTQEMQSPPPRREGKASDKRYQETADILARHLGKPEELATEVFRPKETKLPQSSTPKAPQPTQPTPALSPEVEQTLTGMAADLTGLRSAVQCLAEQVSQLVILGNQQIDAVARLAPALVESTEGLLGGLRQVASAIQTIPHLPHAATDQQSVAEAAANPERTQAVGAEPTPVPAIEARTPAKQRQGTKQVKQKADQATSAPVVVKSIADAKRPDRFYTSIRLPRELWDRVGFEPNDRLLLDWSGRALTIERTAEGGVKPKSIGSSSVILQSWKLGNLNFDQPNVTGGSASLRLSVAQNRQKS
jgi:hypothetical protein